MDFNFSDIQTMLRDSLSRYLSANHSFDARREMVKSPAGFSGATWKAFAEELGILGAPFAESDGGLGGGAVENMVIMEEMGRALCAQPYLSTVVLGGALLRGTGQTKHIPAIISGDVRIAFAYTEKTGRYNLQHVKTTAYKQDGGYVISGHKAVVRDAPSATHIIVVARTAGDVDDANGLSLFLLSTTAAGLVRRDYPLVDGAHASELFFEDVAVSADALMSREGAALPIIQKAIDEAIVAVCAEAVGVLHELHRQTLDYAKQRKQFGKAIADFQVLQHGMVDMFMETEQAQSMTVMATLSLDATPQERSIAVSAAKARVGKALTFSGQKAIQIHGGMGMTNELAVGHYFKRATMIASQFGSVDHHLAQYEQLALAG
jgi:alkylation response protein AidB-like acyl-CoA dehydrogenase